MTNGPPKTDRVTSYLVALLALSVLVIAAVVAFAIVGLDASSTPLAVSALGFVTTVGGLLLLLLRLETVSQNVNGHLSKLTDINTDLHAQLTGEPSKKDDAGTGRPGSG